MVVTGTAALVLIALGILAWLWDAFVAVRKRRERRERSDAFFDRH